MVFFENGEIKGQKTNFLRIFIEYNIKFTYIYHDVIINTYLFSSLGGFTMKHIKTLNERVLKDTIEHGGCGECQTSCQSACKTSCTVGNQHCENENNK